MQRWDIFCRVVDNYGDIGTCWRLAQQLADEHQADVRLWVDKLESFHRLCPSASITAAVQRVGPVEIRHWLPDFPNVDVADVVIEAFACEIPLSYVTAMTQRSVPPIWINLEYLSAEAWVEDCHRLPSPQSRSPLKKYFFFPGFTSRTGGLLRERGLLAARSAFDSSAATAFLQNLGIAIGDNQSSTESDDELRVSLFCYDNQALPGLLQTFAEGPAATRLLAMPGPATDQVANWLGQKFATDEPLRRGSLIAHAVPFLSQSDYDRLLWSCDVNFVRGEDSFVRAQWAEQPFVWQIYPQTENTHLVKLDAFLTRFLCDFKDSQVVRRCYDAWNGIGNIGTAWREFAANRHSIQQHGKEWVGQLDRLDDLANNLVRFVCER